MAAAKSQLIMTTGKRKTSVARASVKKGSGKIVVNNQDLEAYVNNGLLTLKAKEPLFISELEGKYDFFIKVFGGGSNSQVEAIRQSIARALLELTNDEELRKKFLEYDRSMLVADTRFKEMKKPNNSHARAKRQKSYR